MRASGPNLFKVIYMTTLDLNHRDLSRRSLLRGAVLAAGGGALLGASIVTGANAAIVKQSQKQASYQTTPKGNAHCNTCTQWQAPASCKTVIGSNLSPTGWCTLYIAKW